MPGSDQYSTSRFSTTLLLAQAIRGSQIGWNLTNRSLPLNTRLPPAKIMRDQLKVMSLNHEYCSGNDAPSASMKSPALTLFDAIRLAMSGFMAWASLTAPSMFSIPAPCCTRL